MKKILLLITVLFTVVLAACSNGVSTTSENDSSEPDQRMEKQTEAVVINIDGVDYRATLLDTSATRSLLAELPLEVTFRDYAAGFDEKIADLNKALDYGSDQYDHDPKALDIAYWSPDERLVFYYGDVGTYSGIHIIGNFDSEEALEAIENLNEDSKVRVRLAGE